MKAGLLFVLLLLISIPLIGESVTLKRVRYCTKTFAGICTKSSSPYEFRFWGDAGVSKTHQKSTYIGVYSDPGKSAVRHITLFMAGQQTGNGSENVVTGQYANYKSGCDKKTKSCVRPINSRSLAYKVKHSGVFPSAETFGAVIYDAKFDYLFSQREKNRVEDAYYNWIKDHFYSSHLETIYMSGSSRGSILALRLAKRFKADFPSNTVKIIIGSFDGVAHHGTGELGTSYSSYDNPYNSGFFKGWYTNLSNYYPYKSGLSIFHVVGGSEVIPASSARGFAYSGNDVDYGWYRQNWVDLRHTTIGRDYGAMMHNSSEKIVDAHFDFLLEKMGY